MTLGLSTKNSKNWNFIALGLVLSLVGVLFFGEKLSADDDLQNKGPSFGSVQKDQCRVTTR